MKCPHCDYVDGELDEDGWDLIKGDKGKFFALSGEGVMFRPCPIYKREYKNLFACPNCGKTFIEV